MRKVFLLLTFLLLPAFLPAQESTDSTVEFEFDTRCTNPIQWAATLVTARQQGVTVEEVISALAYEQLYGNLRGVSDPAIEYLISIIATVYEPEQLNPESVIKILRDVEGLCLEIVGPEKPAGIAI